MVKKNASDDSNYERKQISSGNHKFNLKSTNSQIIGTSESYETTTARDNGIESVKKNAPDATVIDV